MKGHFFINKTYKKIAFLGMAIFFLGYVVSGGPAKAITETAIKTCLVPPLQFGGICQVKLVDGKPTVIIPGENEENTDVDPAIRILFNIVAGALRKDVALDANDVIGLIEEHLWFFLDADVFKNVRWKYLYKKGDAFYLPIVTDQNQMYELKFSRIEQAAEEQPPAMISIKDGFVSIALEEKPSKIEKDVQQIKNIIIEKLGQQYINNIDHGLRHAEDLIEKAWILSKNLGKENQINWKVLTAAICLHDLAAGKKRKHGKESADSAEKLLSKFDIFSERDIQKIKEAIMLHDVRTEEGIEKRETTGIEAQILYDIDQWDAFGIKGIYRYLLAYLKRREPFYCILDDNKDRYNSLTFTETQEIVKKDYYKSVFFYTQFGKEMISDIDRASAGGIVQIISKHYNIPPQIIAEKALKHLDDVIENSLSGEIAEYIRFFIELSREYTPKNTKTDIRGYYHSKAFVNFANEGTQGGEIIEGYAKQTIQAAIDSKQYREDTVEKLRVLQKDLLDNWYNKNKTLIAGVTYFSNRFYEIVKQENPRPFEKFRKNVTSNGIKLLKTKYENIQKLGDKEKIISAILEELLWCSRFDPGHFRDMDRDGRIYRDHRKAVVHKILKSKRIDIIADNFGPELITAMWLGVYLLENKLIEKITFHVKDKPFAITDATFEDVMSTVEDLKACGIDYIEQIGQNFHNFLKNKNVTITSDPFWTSDKSFKDLPKHILEEVNKSDLVFPLGAFNLRRFLGDKWWEVGYNPRFRDVMPDELQVDLCFINLVKSDMVVEMDNQIVGILDSITPEWKYSGKYGSIIYVPRVPQRSREQIYELLRSIEKLAYYIEVAKETFNKKIEDIKRMVTWYTEIKPNALILFADDIIDKGAVLDIADTLKQRSYKNKTFLTNGVVVLYVKKRDKNSDDIKALKSIIEKADSSIKEVLVVTNDNLDENIKNEAGEIKALKEYTYQRLYSAGDGIIPKNDQFLGILKSANDDIHVICDISKELELPIVLFSKMPGIYSFAEAFREALLMRRGLLSQGAWYKYIYPAKHLDTQRIRTEFELYVKSILTQA